MKMTTDTSDKIFWLFPPPPLFDYRSTVNV